MPGPINRRGFGKQKPKDIKKTMNRLLSYLGASHKIQLAVVLVCIIISSIASVIGSMFIKTLIDTYIAPLLSQTNPSYAGLLKAITMLGTFYVIGIFSTWLYNFLMVGISQGVLREIRDDMFAHMQTLPVKYFDTHTFGDIMSHYTNDTDTLRQMISQSIPQLFSSAITIISVFFAMIFTSVPLTLLVLITIFFMMKIAKLVTSKCSTFFIRQQKSIGTLNGFIDEMISGQKVIKVFCHEEASKEQFDKLNNELCFDATQANKYANILMPIMGNLGHFLYVLIALVGGILTVSNISFVSIGTIASFLLLSELYNADKQHFSAGKLRCYGTCRCRTNIRPHGRTAGAGQRICYPCKCQTRRKRRD